MINLLPPNIKSSIHYGRQNAQIIRWVVGLIFALAGTLVILFGGQMYIAQAIEQRQADTADSQSSLAAQNLDEVQAQVQDISNSLNLVVQVLSRQVLFSQLIRQVGAAIPEGAVLTNLTINEIDGGIDLSANATDYNTATQVQLNLEDPDNQIFATADILSVRCGAEEDTVYPCQINLRALFGENSQFLLIPDDTEAPISNSTTEATDSNEEAVDE